MKLSFRKREVRCAATRVALLLLATTSGLLPNATFAEAVTRRFPVTPDMIVTAMRYRQLPVDGVQVSLAAPITASSDNPMLDIQTVTQTSTHRAQLRVVCRNHTQCLPFYVAVSWPDSAAVVSLPARPPAQAGPPQAALQQPGKSSDLTVRAGSTATLFIEDAKVHIRLQVVCLQGGSAGDKVRVSTPDHKIAYKAEIVAPNLLKGSF